MQNVDAFNILIEFPARLESIPEAEHNALVGADEPYLLHQFLLALESSGSVSLKTGWEPHHFVARNEAGHLLAFAPVYVKAHSYGEYVFDWAWADAYCKHGIAYYPKLICAVPFTPSVSSRLLVSPDLTGIQAQQVSELFEKTVQSVCHGSGFSSVHILFPKEERAQAFWLQRQGVQYHWLNKGYQGFECFLASLNSNKRKNIRKERTSLKTEGLQYAWYCAEDAPADLRKYFYRCYQSTYHCRGQMPYLTEDFFVRMFETMQDACLLLFAFDKYEQPIAASLFLKGANTLYGRYWGCTTDVRYLHFELCYYQGIEYCIEHGLERFDAGAQGEHKLLRGFEPVITKSHHYIANPDFSDAIQNFLVEEKEYIEQYSEDAKKWLPYRNSGRAE